jgi:uncharacterized protein (DUF58 family)
VIMASEAVKNRSGIGAAVRGTILGPLQLIFASTPAGKVLLAAALIGFVISVKSGSNQVILTTSLILGLLVADSFANFISMRKLDFAFNDVPDEVWAGEETRIGLNISNGKPIIPAGNISVDMTFEMTPGRLVGARTVSPVIPGRKNAAVAFNMVFPARGEVTGAEMRAISAFPMALLVDRRKSKLPIRFVVYPKLGRLSAGFLHELGGRSELARRTMPNLLWGDTMGLREYRPGDSLKRVAWKASAHRRRLVVREFEEPRHTDLIVALDSFLPGAVTKNDLEWMISLTATLLLHCTASGWHIRVLIGGGEGIIRIEVDGTSNHREVLKQLAILQGGRLDRSEALLRAAREPGEEHVPIVLLTLAPQPPHPEEVLVLNKSLRPDVFRFDKDAK